jgi:hypothetical protein
MFRKFSAILVIIFIALYSEAAFIDLNTASILGKNFYAAKISAYHKTVPEDIVIKEYFLVGSGATPECYVFNLDKGGYIIIAADDISWPVIAYAFESSYDPENLPPAFSWWLKMAAYQISEGRKSGLSASDETAASWQNWLNPGQDVFSSPKEKSVTPLLTANWGQGKYYNQLCPVASNGPDGRALVGCVATAMAQVMYYYRFPLQGLGTHGGINYGTTYYRWTEMIGSLGDYNYGVAQLSFHCGKAVNMSYSGTGSGAMTADIVNAMKDHFRYNTNINYSLKWVYTQTNWENLLKSNLDAGRPLIYHGSDDNYGGHAWVCDGYQGSNYFHMNWGWDGSANGYFYLNNLVAGGYDFANTQGCVYNIYPSTGYPYGCTGTTTIPWHQGSIDDGSGPLDNYGNNADCYWLISPNDSVRKIILTFKELNTAANDVVTVYDGASTSDPVLGIYSGNTLPGIIYSTGHRMLVRFTSNGSTTAPGWRAEFDCQFPTYCSGIEMLTNTSGTFNDESGTNDYTYNATCRWRLWPANAGAITLGFTSFNLGANDYIRVYNENTGQEIAVHTGSSMPTAATYPTDKILVFFKSDGYGNAAGFEAYYSSSPSGIDNAEASGFLVYPNPATELITISYDAGASDYFFDLHTLSGTCVISATSTPGSTSAILNAEQLSPGIYVLRISGNGILTHKKIVIE